MRELVQVIKYVTPTCFGHNIWPSADSKCYTEVTVVKIWHRKSYPIRVLDRPLGLQDVGAPSVSRQSANEGGKVVSSMHRPSLPSQERFLVLISIRGWVDPRAIVRPGLSHRKVPVTPSGIEPATFRLVAQCLNQLRHRVPQNIISWLVNFKIQIEK